MQQLLGSQLRWYPGKNEIKLWDRTIYCFGANDESSEGVIRGLTSAGAYCDEITLWPKSYFSMMLSRISIDNAKAFGTTNTDSPFHWFKVDILDRQAELDLFFQDYALDDNLSLSEAYKKALRTEHTGVWYERFILGKWVAAEGVIYDFFTEEYIKRTEELPVPIDRVVGVDYGTSNPTAFILMGRNPYTKPKIWAEDEYYYDSNATGKQKTDDEYAEDFVTFIKGRTPAVSRAYVDPSAISFILALRRALSRAGLFVQLVDADNSVVDGIRTQATLLKSGEYALGKKCTRTIQDYYGYSWDPKAQKRGEDAPLKTSGSDHTKDAERYPLQTIFGNNAIDYETALRD
jgi:PBSX family phage terminase large subunit